MRTPCQSPTLMPFYDDLIDASLDDVSKRGHHRESFENAVQWCNACPRKDACLRDAIQARSVGMHGGYLLTPASYKHRRAS